MCVSSRINKVESIYLKRWTETLARTGSSQPEGVRIEFETLLRNKPGLLKYTIHNTLPGLNCTAAV